MGALPKEVVREIIKGNNFQNSGEILAFLKESFKDVLQEMLETEMDVTLGKDAGFSEKNADKIAWQLLEKTLVKEEIDKLEKERVERADIDEVELIKDLKKITNNDSEKTPDRLKAIELLGKYKGMDKTKDSTVNLVITKEDEEEILKRYGLK